jgi:hypothetical protein
MPDSQQQQTPSHRVRYVLGWLLPFQKRIKASWPYGHIDDDDVTLCAANLFHRAHDQQMRGETIGRTDTGNKEPAQQHSGISAEIVCK